MTEATCLISVNPPDGEKKIGSVGLPYPYTEIKILVCNDNGSIQKECGVDEVGEVFKNFEKFVLDDLKWKYKIGEKKLKSFEHGQNEL